MTTETMRKCKRCPEEKALKDISEFRLRTDKEGYSWREGICIECERKSRNERRKRNKKKKKTALPVTTKSKLKTDIKTDDDTGILTVSVTTQDAPADPKKFLISRGIDPDKYTITGGNVSSWPTPMKLRSQDGSEAVAQVINFRVEAKIVPKVLDPIEFGLQVFNWVKPESKHKVSDRKADPLENILVLPDMHFGYRLMDGVLVSTHDEKALELCLKLIDIIRPDRVVCLGDVMDLPEFSRHPHGYDVKGHTQRSLDAAVTFFNDLREITDAPCEVIEGNHDKRITDWCKEEIKKLAEIPGIEIRIPSVGEMLGFEGKDIRYHGKATKEGFDGYSRGTNVFKYRDWVYTHGEKCGKDAIAQTMQTYCSNIVMGHIHKQSVVSRMVPVPTDRGMTYKRMWGVCPGMVGKQDTTLPGMGVERNYQQGVALITHFTKDNWQSHDSTVTQIPIVDGQCFYGGKLLAA